MKTKLAAGALTLALLMTPLVAQAAAPKLTGAQAQALALKKEPGTVQGKPELTKSNQYQITIKSKSGTHRLMVDGNNGKILSDQLQK